MPTLIGHFKIYELDKRNAQLSCGPGWGVMLVYQDPRLSLFFNAQLN